MNQPNAILECMKPSILLRFHNFTCNKQLAKISQMFLRAVAGVMSERKNLRRSSLGSCRRIRIMPKRQYPSTNTIPAMNGITNGSNPLANLSLITSSRIYGTDSG